MKKTIIVSIVLLTLIMTACSSAPSGMNKETYDKGKEAVDIVEKYNTGDITSDEAVEKLEALEYYLEDLDVEYHEETNNDIVAMTIGDLALDIDAWPENIHSDLADLKELLEL